MVPVSVLLVEDNEDILANLYAYLEPLGYELDCARNGRTGLEMAASGQFDLVVLDIMLPGEDGLSFCRRLRAQSGVPVIFLSALGELTDRVVGLEIGADDYLVKPFSSRELLARIRTLLRRMEDLGVPSAPPPPAGQWSRAPVCSLTLPVLQAI